MRGREDEETISQQGRKGHKGDFSLGSLRPYWARLDFLIEVIEAPDPNA
jgi:hypothetical protein